MHSEHESSERTVRACTFTMAFVSAVYWRHSMRAVLVVVNITPDTACAQFHLTITCKFLYVYKVLYIWFINCSFLIDDSRNQLSNPIFQWSYYAYNYAFIIIVIICLNFIFHTHSYFILLWIYQFILILILILIRNTNININSNINININYWCENSSAFFFPWSFFTNF